MNTLLLLASLPLTFAILSLFLHGSALRRVNAVGSWMQLALVTALFAPLFISGAPPMNLTPDFVVDRFRAGFIVLTCVVMALSVTHADCYFETETRLLAGNEDNRMFYFCLNIFLIGMTSVFLCDNLGFLWISIEATTLFSAPLVYHDKTKDAVEATWKYLIICSVGIAFALLGTIFIFASSQHGAIPQGSLSISSLIAHAKSLDYPLLRLGMIFCFLGYGTKAGVFPLHNWLPDAYSEAPAPASAILAGSLVNCALFGIYQICMIVIAANHESLTYTIVSYMGALTVLAAGLLLIRQHSFKRLWAYSSIENVGIMLVAIGLGSGPLFFLQAVNHSLAKVALFLVTGNIIQSAGSKRLNNIHGVIVSSPVWGLLLALSALAVTGTPPFGSFISEIAILSASAQPKRWPIAVMLLLGIAIAFIAVCLHVGRVLAGSPRPDFKPFATIRASLMPALLVAASFALGIFLKPEYWTLMQ